MAFPTAVAAINAINRGRNADDIVDGDVAALVGDNIVPSDRIRTRRDGIRTRRDRIRTRRGADVS